MYSFMQLLLAVGTKLEHVISQLAQEVAEKHVAIEGDLVVQPSDEHFWFNRPKIVLVLIHIILFQNSFELAFIIWILVSSSSVKYWLWNSNLKDWSALIALIYFKASIWIWLVHHGTSRFFLSKTRNRVDTILYLFLLYILHSTHVLW